MEIFRIAKCKGRILRRFENLEKYKDLYERSLEHDWMAKRLPPIQILLTSGVRNYFCLNDMSLRICMVNFWENYWLKLAKSLCLRKGGHVTLQIAYFQNVFLSRYLLFKVGMLYELSYLYSATIKVVLRPFYIIITQRSVYTTLNSLNYN